MFFFDLIDAGGPVMWVILGCSLLALFLFLLKVFQFHHEEIGVRELLRGLFNVLQRDGYVEALTLCDNTPGPAARLLGAGILAGQRGDENIQQAIDDAALVELPKLERYIPLFGTIAFILPLLGLLGTVLGMLDAFETIQNLQAFSVQQISGPIKEALVTTAAGLSMAIPCHIGYNYLVERVESLTLDMEKSARELTAFFEHHRAAAHAAGEEK